MIPNAIKKTNRYRLIAAGLLLLLLPALASCGLITEPEHPCPDSDDPTRSVSLEFRVHTNAETLNSRALSRADDNGHDEEGNDNNQIEDYICPNDFGVFIFATRAGETDPVLLYYNTSTTDPSEGFAMSGSLGDYTISLTLPSDIVADVITPGASGTFSPLSPNGERSMTITVAMLANIGGSSNNHSDYAQFAALKQVLAGNTLGEASKFSDFIAIANNLTYRGSTSSTSIHIPMYGLSSFTMSESDMYYSRPDDRIELGDISMLRAMMKVRLIDDIQGKSDDGYPRITGATLIYKSVNGYVTPDDPANYKNGYQVHTDRIAATDGTQTNEVTMRAGTIVENSWVACAPVQSLTSFGPSLRVTAVRDAASEPQTFDLDIASIEGITAETMWGSTMLRNHVYTLNVTGVNFGTTLTLTATVADWDDSEFNFDFSDDVSTIDQEGKITWTEGTYANIIDETTLIMSPWHDGKSVAAICRFGLATPLGALWTASLLVDEGDSDAFLFVDADGNPFVDADGNELSTVEGRIDGTLATLRIATRNETPAQNNRVRLQIVVVTRGGQGGADAYTIATDGKILEQWSLIQNQQQQ